MKFEDAFNKTFDKKQDHEAKKGAKFAIEKSTFKLLAFMWSMLAEADFVLDDTVIIGENDNIISTPVERAGGKEKEDKEESSKNQKAPKGGKKTGQKSSIDKTATGEAIEGGNVKKEEEKAATTE
jgi:hypothetical protein